MLDLILFRHGPAEDRAEFAGRSGPHLAPPSDAQRPLTSAGRKRTRVAALGLRADLGELSLILSSPLVRARETAAILGEVFSLAPEVTDRLVPGVDPEALWEDVRQAAAAATISTGVTGRCIALVGHEPGLSAFATWLLTGAANPSLFGLKKAGACRIQTDGARRSQLLWLLRARDLRAGAG